MPAGLAHTLAPLAVQMASEFLGSTEVLKWNSLTWKQLHFPNRIGPAGGVDKNAEQILAWQRLGAGFMEIGTVTPESQFANPGRIVDRDWKARNLWNKMGFPNEGAREIALNLSRIKFEIPVFVNIGKNRNTPNNLAVLDYLKVMQAFENADAFVVNVSSPNTQGLRDLLARNNLKPLCTEIVKSSSGRPVFLKLSPDMDEQTLQEAIDSALASGIEGFVLTNTTLSRPESSGFPKEGGLSGQDLKSLSRQKLMSLNKILGAQRKSLLIVSVGGVDSFSEMLWRLENGADLVQCYSALVFEGPLFFKKMHREWKKLRQGDPIKLSF